MSLFRCDLVGTKDENTPRENWYNPFSGYESQSGFPNSMHRMNDIEKKKTGPKLNIRRMYLLKPQQEYINFPVSVKQIIKIESMLEHLNSLYCLGIHLLSSDKLSRCCSVE